MHLAARCSLALRHCGADGIDRGQSQCRSKGRGKVLSIPIHCRQTRGIVYKIDNAVKAGIVRSVIHFVRNEEASAVEGEEDLMHTLTECHALHAAKLD